MQVRTIFSSNERDRLLGLDHSDAVRAKEEWGLFAPNLRSTPDMAVFQGLLAFSLGTGGRSH